MSSDDPLRAGPDAEVAAHTDEAAVQRAAASAVLLACEQLGSEADSGKIRPDAERDAFIAAAVVRAIEPLITARVSAEADAELTQVLTERDTYHEWADQLAHVLGGDEIGEHISANNPWANALAVAAERDARVRAEERQRIIADIEAVRVEYEALGVNAGWSGGMRRAVTIVRAGSAVPVATPEPVDEVQCPNCEHTIRARMSDAPVATPSEPAPRARCDGQHPYNPLTGEPCTQPPGHECEHQDARGYRWWDHKGAAEQDGQR